MANKSLRAVVCEFQRREHCKVERGCMVIGPGEEELLYLYDSQGLIVEELVFWYELKPDLGQLVIPDFRPPYREFCRHPKECDGKGSCPRDPCCAD